MSKVSVSFNVIGVRDIQGDAVAVVCAEMGDRVSVQGLCADSGEQAYFESDADHLKDWCENYGLAYSHEERICEIEVMDE